MYSHQVVAQQHHKEFYEIANYLELYLLSSHGEDRKFIQIFNKRDPCCFAGDSALIYEKTLQNKITSLGQGHFKIIIDDTHDEHMISDYSLEKINNEMIS